MQAPDNIQNYNRYSYCLNNPLKYFDPSGESFWSRIVRIVKIVIKIVVFAVVVVSTTIGGVALGYIGSPGLAVCGGVLGFGAGVIIYSEVDDWIDKL